MLRLTRRRRSVAGFSGLEDTVARAVVNAIMPAVQDAMPGLIDSAYPSLEAKMPGLVNAAYPLLEAKMPQLMGRAMDTAWPVVQQKLPAMLPNLLAGAMPQLQAKLFPVVEKEARKLIDQYMNQTLGPFAPFKAYIPALTLVATSVSLFASGLIIYKFWAKDE